MKKQIKKPAGILTDREITETAENQVRTDKTEDACQAPEWPDGWDPKQKVKKKPRTPNIKPYSYD